MQCQIVLPSRWVDASRLEAAMQNAGNPHGRDVFEVSIHFPVGCKLMIDAAIRLLSLTNQLAYATRRVQLHFEEGESGTMGYLNRVNCHAARRAEMYIDRRLTLLKTETIGILEQMCQSLELTATQYDSAKGRYGAVRTWLAEADDPILRDAVSIY